MSNSVLKAGLRFQPQISTQSSDEAIAASISRYRKRLPPRPRIPLPLPNHSAAMDLSRPRDSAGVNRRNRDIFASERILDRSSRPPKEDKPELDSLGILNEEPTIISSPNFNSPNFNSELFFFEQDRINSRTHKAEGQTTRIADDPLQRPKHQDSKPARFDPSENRKGAAAYSYDSRRQPLDERLASVRFRSQQHLPSREEPSRFTRLKSKFGDLWGKPSPVPTPKIMITPPTPTLSPSSSSESDFDGPELLMVPPKAYKKRERQSERQSSRTEDTEDDGPVELE